jgi:hypothetical protein
MRFTQTIREHVTDPETGARVQVGPSMTITVEATEDFPLSPDTVSNLLGHTVAKWLGPNRSISFRSTIDPWPLPDSWATQRPTGSKGEDGGPQPCPVLCAHCKLRPAACVGAYEDMPEALPACDTCCGHACEDGHCDPLEATQQGGTDG